jgi:hypothetical protein
MRPNITCTRCGTVVPWGPYCPHCVAYLEFAGDPPWAPDVPVEDPPAQAPIETPTDAAAINLATAAAASSDLVVESEDCVTTSSEPEVTPEPAPIPLASEFNVSDAADLALAIGDDPSPAVPVPDASLDAEAPLAPRQPEGPRRIPWNRPTRSQRRGYIAAATLSGIVVLAIALLAGWGTLLVTIPVIMGWALVSGLLFFVEHVHEEEHAEEHEEEHAEEHEEEHEEEGGLEARAPQLVEAVTVKPRSSTVTRATMGDTPCPTCGKPNGATRSYCDWCGGIMAGATLAPSTQAHIQAADDDEADGSSKSRKGGRRSPNRSWRNPLMAGGVVLIVLSTLLIAFFGPGALQLRVGITRVYQQISQWLDPFTGDQQSIQLVTASSTLPGTDPDLMAGSDVRTFWASNTEPGFGIGTTITYELADSSVINRMIIFPGIQGPQFDTRALATPREITLTFDDLSSKTVELDVVDEKQSLRQLVEFDPVATQTVTMTINTVYPPRDAAEGDMGEVAISGTEFLKVPAAPPIIGIQQGMREPKLPGLPGSVGG